MSFKGVDAPRTKVRKRIAIVVAATCDAVPIPACAKGSHGQYIAKSKTVTDAANVEKGFADSTVWSCGLPIRHRHVMPWRSGDRMTQIGANDIPAGT